MKFLGPCIVEHIDGRRWRLWREMCCEPDSGPPITVPAGFETDFGSIPFGVRNTFPQTGKWGPACILHDYCLTLYPRERADDLLLEGMLALDVKGWKRRVIIAAVRAYSSWESLTTSS